MELKRNIKKEEHRNKIGYIHIGAIQVLIKATFQEGINSLVELVLKDEESQIRLIKYSELLKVI